MEELKENTWYWISVESEGDTFFPIYHDKDGEIYANGELCFQENFLNTIFNEAIMPSI